MEKGNLGKFHPSIVQPSWGGTEEMFKALHGDRLPAYFGLKANPTEVLGLRAKLRHTATCLKQGVIFAPLKPNTQRQ